MTNPRGAEIARIILDQLGGQHFKAMTGARNFVYSDGNRPDEISDLTFKVGRNRTKTTHVRIALKADDTYRMYFLHWESRKMQFRTGLSIDTVYASDLRNGFKTGTGLDTSL
jgi:hypothetical protein